MAHATAAAFRDDQPLLFEAGTGIGKSLAYLVPGIIHATDCGRQMIVSTHTISLQEQIEQKDLPLCRKLFGTEPELSKYAAFKSTVLVGKSNYLCTSRLSHALADRATLFDDAGYAELQRIADWGRDRHNTGLRHDLQPPPNPEVWDSVNADSSSCSRRSCDCERCFYQRARARVRSAQVIVVNHALLFSLINAGGARAEGAGPEVPGILFPGDFVVLDEAHTVGEVAEESFGLSLSSFGIERTLKHLFNPRTRRGLMKKHGDAKFRQAVTDALEASVKFFGFLAGTLLAERPIVRVREPGLAEPLLSEPLAALERAVGKVADSLEDGRERDELLDQRGRLRAIRAGIDEWLGLSNEGHVYWAERGGTEADHRDAHGARRSTSRPELERCLFGSGEPASSARARPSRWPARWGRSPQASGRRQHGRKSPSRPSTSSETCASMSPRTYRCRLRGNQGHRSTPWPTMWASAASGSPGAPSSSSRATGTCRRSPRWSSRCLASQNRPFLMQGGGASRTEMAQRMRDAGNAVLFGTDSFWTGVDVPREMPSRRS